MPSRAQLRCAVLLPLAARLLVPLGSPLSGQQRLGVTVTFPETRSRGPLDGRLLLLVSTDSSAEPRFQIGDGPGTQLVFGVDVEGWRPEEATVVDGSAFGYPVRSLASLPPGRYWTQVVLNRYETFNRADGHVVKLPPDRGEGQQWSRKPGNLYSAPRWVRLDAGAERARLVLDQEIPPIAEPAETKYVKHVRIQSERLSKFWGRPMYLGAHVLLPEGYDAHPEARYPLVVNHGHFPYDFSGFRPEPPDPTVPCTYSARFGSTATTGFRTRWPTRSTRIGPGRTSRASC